MPTADSEPSSSLSNTLARAFADAFGVGQSAPTTPGPRGPAVVPRAPLALLLLVALVMLGDRLFGPDSFAPATATFLAAAALAVAALHRARRATLFGIAMVATVLGLVETVNPITVSFAVVALALFTLGRAGLTAIDLSATLRALRRLLLLGPFRTPLNIARTVHAEHTAGSLQRFRSTVLSAWLLPVALGLAFLLLFSFANPLIARLLAALDPIVAVANFDGGRVLIWIALCLVVWPLLRPAAMVQRRTDRDRTARWAWRPDSAAVFRVLAVSNALFAVQTLTDLSNLWPGVLFPGLAGGFALPDGVTYAEYARQGAYPLLAAASLAAAIILAVMRPELTASGDRRVQLLIHVWIGQTLLLLASAALRLDLYVDAYALTRMRLAAFIWMALVAAGLGLIVARIRLDKPNSWLVGANLAMLIVAVYAAGLINVDNAIAAYNIRHSQEVAGSGPELDRSYLCYGLGTDALPAISDLLRAGGPGLNADTYDYLKRCRSRHIECLRERLADWRTWNWRDQRLLTSTEANALFDERIPAVSRWSDGWPRSWLLTTTPISAKS